MSLTPAQTLRSLAMGQALLVAPALGDSYAGKTAGTIAALLLILADEIEGLVDRQTDARRALVALLSAARPADAGLAAHLAEGLKAAEDAAWPDAEDRLMALLARLHAWADDHDPRLAHRCRELLAERTAAERLHPPALPG